MTKQMTVVVTGALRVKKKFLTLDVWADILNTENKKLQVIGERIKLKQTDEREYWFLLNLTIRIWITYSRKVLAQFWKKEKSTISLQINLI